MTVGAGVIAACHGGAQRRRRRRWPANAHHEHTMVAYSAPEPGLGKVTESTHRKRKDRNR